ncbi:hypothetical protein DAQ1742_00915 [Dickeya aquatica]|uniref:Uncharacterized protein n=1 Tax=Dickeya aquatica TaxID=1401087 RepID=A0A375A7L8_9GAMM|nr:hypothetical protein DAQ1742_00915 [Dickeya aquatica]
MKTPLFSSKYALKAHLEPGGSAAVISMVFIVGNYFVYFFILFFYAIKI